MFERQLVYRGTQFRRDRSAAIPIGRHGGVIARRPDDQTDFSRTRQTLTLRPGAECAIEITGQDGNVAAGDEGSDPRLEFLELPRFRSRPFRKNDQDVAGIRQKLAADREALAHMRLTRERQRVYDDGRDPGARNALEKIIGGSGGKGAVQSAERQTREQANGVEMAGMIRHENKRAITPQMFFADDLESAVGAE